MNEETYKANVMCGNCDFMGEIDIPKGVKISDKECPKCGCQELTQGFSDEPPVRLSTIDERF